MPTVSLRELRGHTESQWRPLLGNGVLVEGDTPEEIELSPGRFLTVTHNGKLVFGFDQSEDYPTPHPLTREDIVEYRVVLSAFLTSLRGLNGIEGRPSVNAMAPTGLHLIGRKSLSDGVSSVWLALALGSADDAAGQLAMLIQEDAHAQHVVVFPLWPEWPAATVSALSAKGVFLADLDPDSLTIRWPRELMAGASSTVPSYGLIFEGASWRLHFLGEICTLPEKTGVLYLARLLDDPVNSWTPIEVQRGYRLQPLHTPSARPEDGTDISEAIDTPLRGATNVGIAVIRRKRKELDAELAKAIRDHDTVVENELRQELAELDAGTTQVAGLDNRARVSGADEKARKNVSKQIEGLLKLIENRHARIGQHIRDHLTLGSCMTYSPTRGEVWQVVFPKK